MTDAEKYEAALIDQEMERAIAAWGPGDWSFLPELVNPPQVTALEAERLRENSELLLTFLERLGVRLERRGAGFQFTGSVPRTPEEEEALMEAIRQEAFRK